LKGKTLKFKAGLTAPLLVLVIYTLLLSTDFIDMSSFEYGGNIYLSLIVLQLLIFVIPGVFYCRIKDVGYSFKLWMRPFSPTKLGFIICATVALIAFSALVRFVQIYTGGVFDNDFIIHSEYILQESSGFSNSLYVSIVFALVPALVEEFVFRGIILTEYRENKYGAFSAVAVSSLTFAMLHFSLDMFVICLAGGIVFAFVVYVTRSVFASMIVHFLYNMYGLFVEDYIITVIKDPENTVLLVFVIVLVFLAFLTMSIAEAERINMSNAKDGVETPAYAKKDPNEKIKNKLVLFVESVFSPTMLLCVLMFLIVSIGLK